MRSQQPTIGGVRRSLRARHGWTLKQMSARSGIPLSTLSKVEHDRLTLTYDKLQMLSQRLNMTMSELFAEPSTDAPEPAVTARRSIGRIDDAVRINTPNYDYHYLCPELRRKRMIPVLANVRAKSLEEFGELGRPPGQETPCEFCGRSPRLAGRSLCHGGPGELTIVSATASLAPADAAVISTRTSRSWGHSALRSAMYISHIWRPPKKIRRRT